MCERGRLVLQYLGEKHENKEEYTRTIQNAVADGRNIEKHSSLKCMYSYTHRVRVRVSVTLGAALAIVVVASRVVVVERVSIPCDLLPKYHIPGSTTTTTAATAATAA